MWGLICSIGNCTGDTRGRMERLAQRLLAYELEKWPQYHGQYSEFGASQENEAEAAASRGRCAGVFDEHMHRKAKKRWLLCRRPEGSSLTHEGYAKLWYGAAKAVVRTMLREDLLKEARRHESIDAPNNPDDPDGGSKGSAIRGGGISPDEGGAVSDEKAVLLRRLMVFKLSTRERLILWAVHGGENITGEKIQVLAGVKKEQCSQCNRTLRERLRLEVVEIYKPETAPKDVVERMTDWAFWTLAEAHEEVDPQRDAEGGIIWLHRVSGAIVNPETDCEPELDAKGGIVWRHRVTNAIIKPETKATGPFIWSKAADSPKP